jgi:hypothetical protein
MLEDVCTLQIGDVFVGWRKRGRGYRRRHTGLTGGWGLPEERGQGGGEEEGGGVASCGTRAL